jgi:hypothetical protein
MVNGKTGAMQELFNLYSSMIRPYHSNSEWKKLMAKANQAELLSRNAPLVPRNDGCPAVSP